MQKDEGEFSRRKNTLVLAQRRHPLYKPLAHWQKEIPELRFDTDYVRSGEKEGEKEKEEEEEERLLFLSSPLKAVHSAFMRPKVRAKRGADGKTSRCRGDEPAKRVTASLAILLPATTLSRALLVCESRQSMARGPRRGVENSAL